MLLIEKIAEKSMHVGDFEAYSTGADAHGQYAAGGVVKGPVKAILGESGPEVVVPMKKKYMKKTVAEMVAHFKKKQRRMDKVAAKKKKKDNKFKAVGDGKKSHGGYDEKSDGSLVPNSSLGNRQVTGMSTGYGSLMGSLHSGGEFISSSVRGGSTPSLR